MFPEIEDESYNIGYGIGETVGLDKGRKLGLAEGREEGRMEARIDFVSYVYTKGIMDLLTIAEFLGVSEAEVKKMLQIAE